MANGFAFRVLLLGAFLTSAAAAQEDGASNPPPQDSNSLDLEILGGVEVRHASEVPFSEKLEIILRYALVSTSRFVAPLYAYPNEIACDDANLERLVGQDGSAAILVPLPTPDQRGRGSEVGGSGTTVALYRPTVTDAVRDARKSWCPQDARHWYFATTYPLEVDIQAEHYLSRNVEQIDAQLRAFRTSKKEGRLAAEPGALDLTEETK